MNNFKTGDRVKVVRESVTNGVFNGFLLRLKGQCGSIQTIDESDNIHWINLDENPFVICLPADMLELEPKS